MKQATEEAAARTEKAEAVMKNAIVRSPNKEVAFVALMSCCTNLKTQVPVHSLLSLSEGKKFSDTQELFGFAQNTVKTIIAFSVVSPRLLVVRSN